MKKAIAIIVVCLVCVGLLSACGSSGSSSLTPTAINFSDYFVKADQIEDAAFIVIDSSKDGYKDVEKDYNDQYLVYAVKFKGADYGLVFFDGEDVEGFVRDYESMKETLNLPASADPLVVYANQKVYDDYMTQAREALTIASLNGDASVNDYLDNVWYIFTQEELTNAKNGANKKTFNILRQKGRQEKDQANNDSTEKHSLDETVSTDIFGVTVKNAQLCYYAEPPQWYEDGQIANGFSACTPSEKSDFFFASRGRSLLCLYFYIENKDKNDWDTNDSIVSFTVNQNGASGPMNGYDLNELDGTEGLDLSWAPVAMNGKGSSYLNGSANLIIPAGEGALIKVVGIVPFDNGEPDAPFDLIVTIKNSSGQEEPFTYSVDN